jgi:hypothetical protein
VEEDELIGSLLEPPPFTEPTPPTPPKPAGAGGTGGGTDTITGITATIGIVKPPLLMVNVTVESDVLAEAPTGSDVDCAGIVIVLGSGADEALGTVALNVGVVCTDDIGVEVVRA